MQQFPESDWKKLRAIRESALNRFCVRALKDIKMKLRACDLENEAYKGYLTVYKTVKRQDKKLSELFDDWRRSTAIHTLMMWAQSGIITEKEFEVFSDETKSRVLSFVEARFLEE
jgi:hypothetical protein